MREVRWLEEQKTLTLTGEPVLECRYAWPETGQKKLDRYYRRLKGQWQRRWERELYWDACLDLAGKRERSRPFTPWTATLLGETTFQNEELLSLFLEARERRGDSRTLYGRSGDIWEVRTGAPVGIPWRARKKICRTLERRGGGTTATSRKRIGCFRSETSVCARRGWRSGIRNAPSLRRRRACPLFCRKRLISWNECAIL